MSSIPEKLHHVRQCFSELPQWIKWENWRKQPWLTQIGAYEYGYDFSADSSTKEIKVIYIGETHSSGFDNRLADFENPDRHTGATKFREKKFDLSNTWVRVYKLEPKKSAGALAQLIERELLWNYSVEHDGELPPLNGH